jgi:Domain of unknown function (DUF6798)
MISRVPWGLLAWSVVFALAHTQAPLYYSNQNQYFLHGLADAGYGHLSEDWLANTRDPTPVFSALVAITHRHIGEWPSYVIYAVLLVVYFISLVRLCDVLPARPTSAAARFIFLTLLVAAHAAVLRSASVRLFGTDYPWYLHCGVANQYVLGPGLQPSAFGVLLVASVAAFAHGRIALAAACCCGAAIFHSTYLLPAAFLTLAYMVVLWRDGRGRAALMLGAGSLLAVLPVVVYNLRQFAPTSGDEFADAQRLLAHFRIPHHALIERWLDKVAVAQIVWILLGVVLTRGSRLFPVLLISALLGLAVTLVQAAIHSNTLALLFPWRISAMLMPVATALILARLSGLAGRLFEGNSAMWRTTLQVACVVAGVGMAIGGGVMMVLGTSYLMSPDEVPVMEYVRDHAQKGEVYLLPISVPDLASAPRGSFSTSFTPAPRAGKEKHLVTVDLQRFRLFTGAPIYVDFKAIPYKDTEVLEWRRRLRRVEQWYARAEWDLAMRHELIREGVTHVLGTAGREPRADFLELVYGDDPYRVYRVRR